VIEVTIAKTDEAPKPAASPAADKPAEAPAAPPAAEAKPEAAAPKPPATLTIDFDGIANRVARVPVGADNYGGLAAKTGHLLYVIGGARLLRSPGDRNASLRIYSIKDRKETTRRRHSWLHAFGRWFESACGPGTGLQPLRCNAAGRQIAQGSCDSGLYVDRVPSEEWNQIFNEVWRRYRDWFYVSNMHGYDWVALREQYKPLLKYVAHRSDLNYVISEMIAELTVQHAYIDGGDFQIPPRRVTVCRAARFEYDQQAGRYRIAKIFEGENSEDIYRSPLTEVGVNASVGDYVLAIDGEELKGIDDIYRLLRNKGDNPVQLTLNKTPSMQGARTFSYRPITDEQNLIYLDWVEHNRERVFKSDERACWLPARSRHGCKRYSRVYQVVLPAASQGSDDHRRSSKRRRQRPRVC
jgi:tricorn protease